MGRTIVSGVPDGPEPEHDASVPPPPVSPVPLVLDTDIGTNVDDALALAFAVRHPGIDLRAVTTVSGDPLRRARIAATLLRLAGREDVEVAAGLAVEPPRGPRVWHGDEGEGLLEPGATPAVSERDAVSLLAGIPAADGGAAATALATVGMQTNLAAALDRDPDLSRRLGRVAVMGGRFAPPGEGEGGVPVDRDTNLVADPSGALRVLDAGLPLLYVPIEVTVRTRLPAGHLDRLRSGDELCRVLAGLVERWQRRSGSGSDGPAPPALHDPLTVACLVERGFVTVERLPVTVALVRGIVRTFVDPLAGQPADVVTDVDAAGFAELWLTTVLRG